MATPIQHVNYFPTYSLETLRMFGLTEQPNLDNSESGLPLLYTCAECRALINVTCLQGHVDWHKKLRRALDETGMLY